MIKSVTMYRNVDNLDIFTKFYTEEIFPRVQNIPEIIGINVTKVLQQINEQVTPDLKEIQLIMELQFESEETMKKALGSINGQELVRTIEEESIGEKSYFIGNEKKVDSQFTKSGTIQNFIEQPNSNG